MVRRPPRSTLFPTRRSSDLCCRPTARMRRDRRPAPPSPCSRSTWTDRKSTRLNSSHLVISDAVFCLKKLDLVEPALTPAGLAFVRLAGPAGRRGGSTLDRGGVGGKFQHADGPPVMLVSLFFNDTATTEISTLSLHDALPICWICTRHACCLEQVGICGWPARMR